MFIFLWTSSITESYNLRLIFNYNIRIERKQKNFTKYDLNNLTIHCDQFISEELRIKLFAANLKWRMWYVEDVRLDKTKKRCIYK